MVTTTQLFQALVDETQGDFVAALQRAVEIAPDGAEAFGRRRREHEAALKAMQSGA